MIRRLVCRLLRHNHEQVRIFCIAREGGPITSQAMDRWSAEYILANQIAPTATADGREVSSCRIVVL